MFQSSMDEILEKLKLLDKHFRNVDKPETTRFLERIVKLNEEVGELCEAALTEVDENQRQKEKDIDFDAELADVVICTLMLSIGRERSVLEEVNAKLDKSLKRFNLV